MVLHQPANSLRYTKGPEPVRTEPTVVLRQPGSGEPGAIPILAETILNSTRQERGQHGERPRGEGDLLAGERYFPEIVQERREVDVSVPGSLQCRLIRRHQVTAVSGAQRFEQVNEALPCQRSRGRWWAGQLERVDTLPEPVRCSFTSARHPK